MWRLLSRFPWPQHPHAHLEEVDEEQAPLGTYTIFTAATIPGNKFFKKKSRASCVSLIPHNESSHTGDESTHRSLDRDLHGTYIPPRHLAAGGRCTPRQLTVNDRQNTRRRPG